jgi:3'-5' exonuclease
MLKQLDLEKILFLDIETVPMVENYELLSEKFRKLWDKKAEYLKKTPDDTTDTLFSRAGIYAEFGKIVCISCGFFYNREFRLKSFYGDDELILLQEFSTMLNRFHTQRDNLLCAHNGKEFDFPFLSRRLLINGLPLPELLDSAGKKTMGNCPPGYYGTLEVWRF